MHPERYDWVYLCRKCREEITYIVELPRVMRVHDNDMKRPKWRQCMGELILIDTKLIKTPEIT